MVVAEHGDITNLPKNVRGNLNELDTRFLIKSQLVKFYSHNMIEGFSEDGCICRFKFHDMICFSLQRKLESWPILTIQLQYTLQVFITIKASLRYLKSLE